MQGTLDRPRLGRLKLRQLQLLQLLLAHGTLHAAAREMHLTVPAVSLMIRDLEGLMGVRLFERSRRGLLPTDAARALAPRCRTLLNELQALDADVERARAQRPRGLRMGVAPHALYVFLPAVLGRLTKVERYGMVLRDGAAGELMQAVLDGEVDCALTRLPRDWRPDDEVRRIAWIDLYPEPLCFVSGPTHPLAARRSVSYAALAAADWALTLPGSVSRSVFIESFLANGLSPPEPMLESRLFIYNLRVAAQSDLLTIGPSRPAHEYEKLGLVRVLRTRPSIQPPPVVFAYRATLAEDPMLRRLTEVLREVARTWRSSSSDPRHT